MMWIFSVIVMCVSVYVHAYWPGPTRVRNLELKCPETKGTCHYKNSYGTEHEFVINGETVSISYNTSSHHVEIRCDSKTPLYSSAMPSYTTKHKAKRISFHNCLVPNVGAIEALNVTHLSEVETLELRTSNVKLDINDIILPVITRVSLTMWEPHSKPTPVTRCDSLQSLNVKITSIIAMPSQWVAACPRLQTIDIFSAHLKELPDKLLENATNLTYLSLGHDHLTKLPKDLFHYSPKLQYINLIGNLLTTLPGGLFAKSIALRELNLSYNKLLTASIDVVSVPALYGLVELNLSSNPSLSDLCDSPQGLSKLSPFTKLEKLSLALTNITTICLDWRTTMPHLKLLDLKNTSISYIQRIEHTINLKVQLSRIIGVVFDEHDYLSKPSEASVGNVTYELQKGAYMQCDCNMYWTWRSLRDGRWPVRLNLEPPAIECAGAPPRHLKDLTEDELMCVDVSECGPLPAGCQCETRPADGGSRHLRVSCERAALSAPPHLRHNNYSVDLLLAHNNISRLHLNELPPNFKRVDLRNNTVRELDVATVTGLVREGRHLMISMNPLSCSCSEQEALEILREHAASVEDYTAAVCEDRRPLASLTFDSCSSSLELVLGVSLSVLLAVILAVIICLVRRDSRMIAAVLLHRVGMLPRRNQETDDDRRFDVFVSFSHEDEGVMLEIVRWLESRSPPYRLCLHYRDWVPGRSIPEQISESVMLSQRTLALVSSSFLNSTWARAEFREAHALALRDVTRRLVVVLLQDKGQLELDTELRRYLALNTYVQWGDAWFWDKLKLALPRPRPLSPPPSPSLSRAMRFTHGHKADTTPKDESPF